MKKSLFMMIATFLFFVSSASATNFEPGDALKVFANSGLKLRMEPSQHAESVLVIPFGDEVIVLNTFDFPKENADRIGWIDGHWVLVDYFGLQGYVFDGFLSSLPIPDHESELCGDCSHLIYPFDQYLDDHFGIGVENEVLQQSELVNQFVHQLDSNILRKRSYADSWFHLEVTMENMRIGEVLNLLRSMIMDKRLKNEFENSLTFRTNAEGLVNSIQIKMYENPIRINRTQDGKVKLSTTVIHMSEDGC